MHCPTHGQTFKAASKYCQVPINVAGQNIVSGQVELDGYHDQRRRNKISATPGSF